VIGLILDIYNDFSCPSFDECQRIYPKGKGKMYEIHPFEGYYQQDFSQYLKQIFIQAAICTALKS
jgi:hypothetical protein